MNHARILSLPFDVLIRIIEFAAEDAISRWKRSELDPLVERLSSVCRAFRNAVLNTVMLWTKIDDRYCLRDDFSSLMARSKRAQLTIDIDLGEKNWRNVLSKTLPYKDRWRRLDIELDRTLNVECVMKAFPDIEFPALERVEIFFELLGHDYDRIFIEWKFPSATYLEISDWVPPIGCMPSLRVLKLDAVTLGLYSQEDAKILFRKLMDFLVYARSLDVIHFDLSSIDAELPDELHVVELPHIKELRLSNTGLAGERETPGDEPPEDGPLEPLSLDALSLFARSIKVPNVQEYSLRMIFEQQPWYRSFEWFVASFDSSPGALYPVTDLFVTAQYPYTGSSMVDFFSLFRDVREMVVDIPHVGEELLDSGKQLNLRHLHSLSLQKETDSFVQAGPMRILRQLSANPKRFTVKLHGHDVVAWEMEPELN